MLVVGGAGIWNLTSDLKVYAFIHPNFHWSQGQKAMQSHNFFWKYLFIRNLYLFGRKLEHMLKFIGAHSQSRSSRLKSSTISVFIIIFYISDLSPQPPLLYSVRQLDGFFVSQIFMTPVRLSKSTLENRIGDGHPISQKAHTASSCTRLETNH